MRERSANLTPAPRRRYWDHVLRGDEQLEQVVEYVLHNPVRAGLVERWCDYRVSGSSVVDLADVGGGKPPPYSENQANNAYASVGERTG